jgi:hypothetical protein
VAGQSVSAEIDVAHFVQIDIALSGSQGRAATHPIELLSGERVTLNMGHFPDSGSCVAFVHP